MNDVIPIYEGEDFYVPEFGVKLRGRPVGKDVLRDVLSAEYTSNIEQIDSFKLVINNWDADERSFKYSDEDLFLPGKELELWMGYYGNDNLRRVITGEITQIGPTFPSSGQPKISVSGLNVLHRFRTKQESHAYENMTDSEIAQQIGARLNVSVRTDPERASSEERYKFVYQDNKYDIVFLMQRARRIGYDLFVEETSDGESRLYFGPTVNLTRRTYRLTYGRSLIEFQPTLTTANQVGEVVVRGWDQVNKKKIEATASRKDIQTVGVGTRAGQGTIDQSFNQRQEVIADRPIQSEQEAKTLAVETLERIAKDMIKGSGATVGLPDLQAGSLLVIDGLGDRFSGRYFVTQAVHAIGDGGYTTRFQCRREEVQEP